MRQDRPTYIYRISDRREGSAVAVRYVYAKNKGSAKQWQLENCPEIRAKIECIGESKDPLPGYAREFTQTEYAAMKDHLSKMSDPVLLKLLTPVNKILDRTEVI